MVARVNSHNDNSNARLRTFEIQGYTYKVWTASKPSLHVDSPSMFHLAHTIVSDLESWTTKAHDTGTSQNNAIRPGANSNWEAVTVHICGIWKCFAMLTCQAHHTVSCVQHGKSCAFFHLWGYLCVLKWKEHYTLKSPTRTLHSSGERAYPAVKQHEYGGEPASASLP